MSGPSTVRAGLLAGVLACLAAAGQPASAQGYVPHRVYDTRAKRFVDFEQLAARAVASDVVFFGEEHDHLDTHRFELYLLGAIRRRRPEATVAMEMFERDNQAVLDRYLAGEVSEEDFLAASRPWPRYADHYRAIVEFARAHGWRVIASNVPRKFASMVASGGLAALDTMPAATRAFAAAELRCEPKGTYYKAFSAVMAGMPTHGSSNTSAAARATQLVRVYEAQCLKDETMAESIARAWSPGGLVVHYNGSFHSDQRLGTAERTRRRLGKIRELTIVGVPVADLDAVSPSKDDRKRGDYLLYLLTPPKADSAHGKP
ncbi:MAG: ChaN family lipoprotein [Gemmatimonadales bacterium]